jgi:hypothetical protein
MQHIINCQITKAKGRYQWQAEGEKVTLSSKQQQ